MVLFVTGPAPFSFSFSLFLSLYVSLRAFVRSISELNSYTHTHTYIYIYIYIQISLRWCKKAVNGACYKAVDDLSLAMRSEGYAFYLAILVFHFLKQIFYCYY